MSNIYGIKRKDLEDYFLSKGEKKYKALQIFEWLYQKKVRKYSEMTNIKQNLREELSEYFTNNFITIEKKQEDKLTKKYLFRLEDDNYIEAVLMEHDYGLSICVSSEVGCNMGCAFCESGRLKKVRNLETYEMVEQILLVEDDIKKRISSVVIMGIGEPLDNYDNVMDFIKIINDAKGLAKAYKLKELIETIKEYTKKTNRRVTIEYVMLNGVNDNETQALELARLLKGLNVYVNLIPYNETSHLEFKKSTPDRIKKFYDILIQKGLTATTRKEFGSKIDAACGQLRSKEVKS